MEGEIKHVFQAGNQYGTIHGPVGGGGERKTLWLVAKYADACSFVIGTELKEAGGLTESREKSIDYLRRKLRKLW